MPHSDTTPGQTAAPARTDVTEYGIRRLFVTLAVILGAIMEIVDTTIVNVALPTIQGNVGASQDEGTFIVTGYIVANVVVIPLSPWLQQRFGRKQYFGASLVIFTLASVMCGFSHDLWSLVIWRLVQGAGGGGLLSQAQAILRETYPREQQGTAQTIFAVGAIVGPTVGPLMGGIITDNFSWEWCFFVNVPFGLLAAGLTYAYLRNPEAPRATPVDAVGVTLLAVGLAALQYVLDQGQEKDWFGSSLITWLAVVAAIGLAAFLVWELFLAKQPAVDLTVLRYQSVWAGSLLGMALGITLLGTLVTLPQYVQGPLGFTATQAGQLISVRAFPIMLFTPLAGALAARGVVDPRWQIGAGFIIIGISNWMLAGVTTPLSDFAVIAWPMILSGIGLAQVFVPLSLVVFGSVPTRDIPKASAMFNLARQLGGSLATALLITLLSRATVVHQTDLSANISRDRAPVVAYLAARGGSVSPANRSSLDSIVHNESLILGYADTDRYSAIVTFLLAPLVLLLKKPAPRPAAAVAGAH